MTSGATTHGRQEVIELIILHRTQRLEDLFGPNEMMIIQRQRL